MESQRTRKAKIILTRNDVCGISLTGFKTYFYSYSNKDYLVFMEGLKYRQMEQKKENP